MVTATENRNEGANVESIDFDVKDLSLAEKGVLPPGRDPAHQRVRSAAVILPPDQAFGEAAKEDLSVRPGLHHSTV